MLNENRFFFRAKQFSIIEEYKDSHDDETKYFYYLYIANLSQRHTNVETNQQQSAIRCKSKYILYTYTYRYSSCIEQCIASRSSINNNNNTIYNWTNRNNLPLERGVHSIFYWNECPAVCLPHYFVTAQIYCVIKENRIEYKKKWTNFQVEKKDRIVIAIHWVEWTKFQQIAFLNCLNLENQWTR